MNVRIKNIIHPLLFAVGGALAGLAYYYFVGCASGACAITSSPITSKLYMAIMGLFLSAVLKKD